MAINGKGSWSNFILPEKEISLKVVFDNLRNYAIIGGIVALAHWIDSGKANFSMSLLPRMNFPQNRVVVWTFSWSCLSLALRKCTAKYSNPCSPSAR